jgi:NAD-dependent deacetylase sirtuin 5
VSEKLRIPNGVDISDATIPLPPVPIRELPRCPQCDKLLRPNVVFFGEPTSNKQIAEYMSGEDIELMIVVGTSAVVLPAALYIPMARNKGARVAFFNLEEIEEEPGGVMVGD